MFLFESGIRTARALTASFANCVQTTLGIGAQRLNHVSMFGDLFSLFNQGPTPRIFRDTTDHVKREFADLKRKIGLRLDARDAVNMLSAINGIDGSRLYNRAYEFICDHIKALASKEALARLGDQALYPPTADVIKITKSFDKAEIPHTLSFLEEVARNPAIAEKYDFNARLQAAMEQDGDGAYEYFTGKALELTYTIAFKAPTVFLKDAIASIPDVEPYILESARAGKSYYDTLLEAPKFLRALIYIAEANQPGHLLNGADVVFPFAASEKADEIVDGYLRAVLGESGAGKHPFFSANRQQTENQNPENVQEELNRQRAPQI